MAINKRGQQILLTPASGQDRLELEVSGLQVHRSNRSATLAS